MSFWVSSAWAHTASAPALAPPVPPPAVAVSGSAAAASSVPPFVWNQFEVHWSTIIGIVLLSALYLWGIGPLRRRHGWAERTPVGQALVFHAGLLALFFSLNGPLHDLSDTYLFSAHMVQHLLLAQVIPPLLLLGTPGWLLRPLIRNHRARGLAHRATTLPAGFVLYSGVFSLWHIPLFYNYMMAHHNVHIVMHLMVLVTATCMWWPVMSSLPELPRPSEAAQMMYLFLLGLPMMAVAALLTLISKVLYPWYTQAPRMWGLSPHDDQVLGGLIMWVPGGLAYWVALTIVWFKWARRERRGDSPEPLTIPSAPLLTSTHAARR